MADGYYAARLTVLRLLTRQGRQAGVLAVREISVAYWSPLEVWVVREVARAAMRSPPARFGSLAEAMAEMKTRISTLAGQWRREARLLAASVQRSLWSFSAIFLKRVYRKSNDNENMNQKENDILEPVLSFYL